MNESRSNVPSGSGPSSDGGNAQDKDLAPTTGCVLGAAASALVFWAGSDLQLVIGVGVVVYFVTVWMFETNAERTPEGDAARPQARPPRRSRERLRQLSGPCDHRQLESSREAQVGVEHEPTTDSLIWDEKTEDEVQPRFLFGQIAILAGLITEAQRDECLRIQAKAKDAGRHFYLATILVNRGDISIEQALQILMYQDVQIVQDATTGNRYNLHEFNPKKKYRSPDSTEILTVLPSVDSLAVRGDLGLRKVTRAEADTPIDDLRPSFTGLLGDGAITWPANTSDDPFGGDADDDPFCDARDSGGEPLGGDFDASPFVSHSGESPAPFPGESPAPRHGGERRTPGSQRSETPLVFVAMPFDDRFWPVWKAIRAAIEAAGADARRVDLLAHVENIHSAIFAEIERCNVMVADLSPDKDPHHANQNVVYEVAHANAIGKPSIIVSQSTDTLAFDTRVKQAIIYSDSEDGRKNLTERLTDSIRAALTAT